MKSIIESYFPKQTKAPFASAKEERGEFLLFLDLLCLISVQQAENDKEESISRVGALLSDEDLMRAIEPHESKIFPYQLEVRDIYDGLMNRAKLTVENPEVFAPISRLFCSGLLEPIEQLSFLLSFSYQNSEKYGQMFAKLMRVSTETAYPTVGLCMDFSRLYLSEDEAKISVLANETSYLNSVLLQKEHTIKELRTCDKSILNTVFSLKRTVSKWILETPVDDSDLEQVGEYLNPISDEEYVCHPEVLEELMTVCSYFANSKNGASTVVELSGKEGCGKRFLLSLLSGKIQTPIFAVDALRLFALPLQERNERIDELCLRASLFGQMVYLYHISEKEKDAYHFASRLLSVSELLFFGCENYLSDGFYQGIPHSVYRLRIPDANAASQFRLWEEAAKSVSAVFSKDMDLWETVSKYTMTPGRIYLAVKNTVEVSASTEEGLLIEKEELERQIRRICSVGFGESAKKISSPFSWEDLIIEEDSKKQLFMAMNRVRLKGRVNDGYGFGERFPYGKGTSIVLYGPPGTGKTMAAGVLANALGLDLYRIDLSQMSSKYIGETEKNLGAIFDTAENSNVILFFDEADSIFAKRTDVSSSNDRHANEQTGYLLQRIEEYPGISILATNNMQNFDAAFKRRMTYLIPIGIPEETTREKLWRQMFPKKAPLADDVDFEILAKVCEISGSNIKSAALQAAYLAAAENRKITMGDIATAVDMECVKVGTLGMKNEILSALLKKES